MTWQSNIPKITARSRAELKRLVRRTALSIEAQAKISAPVDTGFLRNSISTSFPDELTGVVSVGAEYGIYVEMGTVRTAAQPYLLPAAEAELRKLGGELKKVI